MDEFKQVEEAGKALVIKNKANKPFLAHLRLYVQQTKTSQFSLAAFQAHVASFPGDYDE